jgi:hypothetical protein
MTDIDRFRQYSALADEMLQRATHDELVEALKILALNLEAYKERFGELPQPEVLDTLRSDEIGSGMANRLTGTMAQIIGVMRSVMTPDTGDLPN